MMKIDVDFQDYIIPLAEEGKSQLEKNLLKDGCRDPLVVWNGILIDGHNRYEICTRLNIPFKTTALEFETREEVEDWIDKNQLGRRNLTPDQMSLIRGRIYNRVKKAHGGDRKSEKSRAQSDPLKTADLLSQTHHVSSATIKRDGKFAEAVEKVKTVTPDIEKKVATKQAPPKKAIIEASKMIEEYPEEAKAIINGKKTMAQVVREVKKIENIKHLENIDVIEAKEIAGVFDVIVIDPPWPMKKIPRDVRPNQTGFDYPVMEISEIKKLKIPMDENCHVWLWTTHKFLPDAFDCLKHWGLKYVCCFTWHKPGGFQAVGLPQFNCEFCLYARKGSPKFIDTKAFPVCFEAPRGSHSEKPEYFYDIARRVTTGRRLDMFNRRVIEGFETFGKEAA